MSNSTCTKWSFKDSFIQSSSRVEVERPWGTLGPEFQVFLMYLVG